MKFGQKLTRTPWSRSGDGRLTLKGGVREVLATGMLEAQGVDTSKSFSLIETGESLERGDEPSPTRSAVLVRLSHGHIRIGSFQRVLALGETDNIARLLDHTIETHRPDLWRDALEDRAALFLEDVVGRVAETGARWAAAGFVHGVLNTDNINVTGESFDYGPWRFLPVLDPGFTAAYFDQTGLYSFGRQPEALFWNLARLADCLLPLCPQARLEAALERFGPALQDGFTRAVFARLGLAPAAEEPAGRFVAAFWRFLAESRAPFERVFFDWYGGAAAARRAEAGPLADLYAGAAFAPVRTALGDFVPAAGARLDDPYFAGEPCTMLVEEVEALWAPIAERDDWSALDAKLAAIAGMARAYGTVPAAPGAPAHTGSA